MYHFIWNAETRPLYRFLNSTYGLTLCSYPYETHYKHICFVPLSIYSDVLHSFLNSQFTLVIISLLLKLTLACIVVPPCPPPGFCFSVLHLYFTYIVEGVFAACKILGWHCVFVLVCLVSNTWRCYSSVF